MIRSYRQKRSNAPAIIAVLLVMIISFSAWRDLFGLRQLVQAGLYPFQYVTVVTWKGLLSVPAVVLEMRDLSGVNAQLKQELAELKTKQLLLDELGRENDRFRAALSFRQGNHFGFGLKAVQVIGKSPDPWLTILEIGAGSQVGVRVGMTAIVKTGLVGRVVEVAPYSAKVMLITDPDSSVAAALARSRDYGVVEGDSSGTLLMKFVSSTGDAKAGDLVVTSSLSTMFPGALPVGTVIKATKREHDLFYDVRLKPAVNFSKLEEVFLVL